MNTYPTYHHSYNHGDELVAYVDRYQLYENSRKFNYKVDPKLEAQLIKLLLGVLARQKRLIALVDQDDKEGIEAYSSEGYHVYSMNGDRPDALLQLVSGETKQLQLSPEHMVVISTDRAFGLLCSIAAQNNTHVSVWATSPKVPPDLLDARFDTRQLSELLPDTYIKLGTAIIWLDIENLLITLKKKGIIPTPKSFVEAVQAATNDLGNVTATFAHADFTVLAPDFGHNLQRELEQLGIKTRYQINMRGKNSADMEISSDIHTMLELDPNIQTLIIGTGDRDFRPTVEAAHKRGKKVVILALRDNLSNDLERAADEVRFLDKYFTPGELPQSDPVQGIDLNNEWVKPLMRLAALMHWHRWQWVFKNNLLDIAPLETWQQGLEVDLLKPRQPGCTKTLTFNENHPLARTIHYFIPWFINRIDYLINKKGMKYVDTAFIANGMTIDKTCQELGIGQNRSNANAWLEVAHKAGIIIKKQQPHPNDPHKIIDTWWPVRYNDNSTTEPKSTTSQSASAEEPITENKNTSTTDTTTESITLTDTSKPKEQIGSIDDKPRRESPQSF